LKNEKKEFTYLKIPGEKKSKETCGSIAKKKQASQSFSSLVLRGAFHSRTIPNAGSGYFKFSSARVRGINGEGRRGAGKRTRSAKGKAGARAS
jgi:hypothetical protein